MRQKNSRTLRWEGRLMIQGRNFTAFVPPQGINEVKKMKGKKQKGGCFSASLHTIFLLLYRMSRNMTKAGSPPPVRSLDAGTAFSDLASKCRWTAQWNFLAVSRQWALQRSDIGSMGLSLNENQGFVSDDVSIRRKLTASLHGDEFVQDSLSDADTCYGRIHIIGV